MGTILFGTPHVDKATPFPVRCSQYLWSLSVLHVAESVIQTNDRFMSNRHLSTYKHTKMSMISILSDAESPAQSQDDERLRYQAAFSRESQSTDGRVGITYQTLGVPSRLLMRWLWSVCCRFTEGYMEFSKVLQSILFGEIMYKDNSMSTKSEKSVKLYFVVFLIKNCSIFRNCILECSIDACFPGCETELVSANSLTFL